MNIETIAVDLLIPYARNSRTHSDEQVAQIAASIREFGFTNPVLIDGQDGIIAGHGRVLGARKLGMSDVPCIRLAHLSEAQKRAYVIADNKLALNAGWDEDLLRQELRALDELEINLGSLGFDDAELADLFKTTEGATDPDDTPEPPADPVSRLGDVWLLGDHRIRCGDSTDAEGVAALLAGAKPHLMVTDPPYGIGYDYDTHDDRNNAKNADLVEAVFAHAPKGRVWTPGLMNLARDIDRFGPAKVLCWHKGFAASGNGIGGASTWEPVLVISPAAKKLPNDYLDYKIVIEQHEGRNLREYHPCPKPVALYAHLVECLSPKAGRLYEPFSGSGTTIIAAEMTGRRCYAMELSPAYVDVAVRRWQNFTGKQAVHADTGKTFDETAAVNTEE